MPSLLPYAIFVYILGTCAGSFLNVVVWRLPRIDLPPGTGLFRELWLTLRGLSVPPSHCPNCRTPLSARDNIPVFGWLMLRGKCRYCAKPISPRYPTVEFVTGLLFLTAFCLMFYAGLGPVVATTMEVNQYGVPASVEHSLSFARDYWLLWLYLPMIACLLAASLIDAELFIIPLWIPWLMTLIGIVGHSAFDRSIEQPGNLLQPPAITLMTVGGAIGLVFSLALLRLGVIKYSFADGEPLLKNEQDAILAGTLKQEDLPMATKDYTSREVRREILHEIVFLALPLALAAIAGTLALRWPPASAVGAMLADMRFVNGALGAMFGGFIGAMWVWATRIFGSLLFGKEAMGMGDVHLMLGVGAILGAGMSSVAFFLAPFPGLLIHLYLIFTDPKRAVPYGPYLSFASVLVIFIYAPIAAYLDGGLAGLVIVLKSLVGA